jgi:hypothetical protein
LFGELLRKQKGRRSVVKIAAKIKKRAAQREGKGESETVRGATEPQFSAEDDEITAY